MASLGQVQIGGSPALGMRIHQALRLGGSKLKTAISGKIEASTVKSHGSKMSQMIQEWM